MNSRKTYIILLIVLAAVIIGATVGYRIYTSRGQSRESEAQNEQTVPASSGTEASGEENAAEVPSEVSGSEDIDEEAGSAVSIPEEDAADTVSVSGSEAAGEKEEQQEELPDAADFTVQTAEGMDVTLSDMQGKPVIVNFWASWCPPCKAELPYFQDAYDQYGSEIRFMMVDLTDGQRETNTTVQQFLKDTGYTFPVFYDRTGEASYAYELYSIPVTVGIDPEGKLVYHKIGAMSENEMQDLIDKLIG